MLAYVCFFWIPLVVSYLTGGYLLFFTQGNTVYEHLVVDRLMGFLLIAFPSVILAAWLLGYVGP